MPNQIVDCSGHVVTVDQAQVEILSAARVDVNPNDDVFIELRTKRNGFIAGARVIVNESEEFTLIPEEVFEVCLQIPGLVDADLASALSRATTYYSTVRQEVPAASGDDGAGSDDAGAAAGPSASKARNPSKARTTAATATTPRPRATPAKGKAAAVDPRLVAALRTYEDGTEGAVLRMRVAKGKPGATKTVPLILQAGGTLLDPVKALRRLFELDPVPDEALASTPLFRRGDGAAFTVVAVRGMVKSLMQRLGEDPRRFGAHSLRIGGATAALAADMSPSAIRAAGRWSSDVYILYTRANRQAAGRMTSVIGSTPFEDLERGVRFADEELLLVPAEQPYSSVDRFVSRDMIDHALDDGAGEDDDL